MHVGTEYPSSNALLLKGASSDVEYALKIAHSSYPPNAGHEDPTFVTLLKLATMLNFQKSYFQY